MGIKRSVNRTEAYKLAKDMKQQERQYKEQKKLEKKARKNHWKKKND